MVTPPRNHHIPPEHLLSLIRLKMDIAYDHIQEENFKEGEKKEESSNSTQNNLSQEFQEAYNAVSNSPWGARIGGLWGTVKKQVCIVSPLLSICRGGACTDAVTR